MHPWDSYLQIQYNIQYYLKYFFTEPVLFIIYKSDYYYYYSQIHIIWNYLLEHQTWYEDLCDKNISTSKLKFQMCIIQTKFCETRTQGMLKRENLNAIATGERFLRAARVSWQKRISDWILCEEILGEVSYPWTPAG